MEKKLQSRYQALLGHHHRVVVLWCLLPAGQSFVAGKAGDIYLAMVEENNELPEQERAAILIQLTQHFAEVCGISIEKPLVTLADTRKVSEYITSNRKRLRKRNQFGFLFQTFLHALISKQRHGYFAIRANLK